MILASNLHSEMVMRVEQQICRVIDFESKASAAKMGGW